MWCWKSSLMSQSERSTMDTAWATETPAHKFQHYYTIENFMTFQVDKMFFFSFPRKKKFIFNGFVSFWLKTIKEVKEKMAVVDVSKKNKYYICTSIKYKKTKLFILCSLRKLCLMLKTTSFQIMHQSSDRFDCQFNLYFWSKRCNSFVVYIHLN